MISLPLNKILAYSRLLREKPQVAARIMNGLIQSRLLNRKPLRNVEIQVTADCNSKCVMCFSSRLKCANTPPISVAEIKTFWQDCLDQGAICAVITGGEPFMRRDLFEIISELQPRKSLIGLLTNCLSVSENDICKLKELQVDYLQVSLDGLTEEENDQIRGVKGHFNKVMNVIGNAKKYGITTSISFTITHQNIKRVPDVCQFATANDLFLNFSPAVPVGKWEDCYNFLLDDADWEQLDLMIKKYPQMRLCFSLNYEGRPQCPAGREKFCLSPYGDVMGCSLNHVSFGNIRQEPLKEIWKKMTDFPYFRSNYKYCRTAGDMNFINQVTRKINESDTSPFYYKNI